MCTQMDWNPLKMYFIRNKVGVWEHVKYLSKTLLVSLHIKYDWKRVRLCNKSHIIHKFNALTNIITLLNHVTSVAQWFESKKFDLRDIRREACLYPMKNIYLYRYIINGWSIYNSPSLYTVEETTSCATCHVKCMFWTHRFWAVQSY